MAEGVVEMAPSAEASTNAPTAQVSDEQPSMKNFFRILSYSTASDRAMIAVAVVSSVGAGVTLPLMNIVFGNLVGGFNGYAASSDPAAAFTSNVNKNALYLVYLWIGKFILGYISMFGFRMTGIRVSAAVRLAYLKALLAQPINVLDKQPPGATTDALTTVANTIQMGISDKLAVFVQSLALVVSAYVVAFKYSWQLTLASTASLIFVFCLYGIIIPIFLKRHKAIDEANSGASSVAGEMFKAIRTIKSLCAEPTVKRRYARWIADAKVASFRIAPVIGAMFSPLFFSIYSNMALTFWLGIKLYLQGVIASVSSVIIVLFSVLLVLTAFNQIASSIQNIAKAAVSAGACFTIIDLSPLSEDGLRDPEVDPGADIEFKDVHFTYPSRPDAEILKGLSMTILAGKITALVGPSGCGKSTIVALLERWYDLSDINERLPDASQDESKMMVSEKAERNKQQKERKKALKKQRKTQAPVGGDEEKSSTAVSILQNSGAISVGPHNLESLSRPWWRSQIGLVQQEPALFNDTIFETIAKGLPRKVRETLTQAEQLALVKEACHEAYADEFIRRLPHGYETKVGESGVKLSGGQRQRLAIARGIVKKPAVLILDEATSSIDVRAERIVQKALDRVSKGRTTVMVAHRLSTIKKADNIIVLRQGVAVEHGTHDELLRDTDGVYTTLVRAQHLELGDQDEEGRDDAPAAGMEFDLLLQQTGSRASGKGPGDEEAALDEAPAAARKKQRGFARSVGLLLWEQRSHYVLYLMTMLGAV